MKLHDVSRRALCVLKQEGFLRAVLRCLHRLCSPLVKFGTIVFFVQDLDFNLPQRPIAFDATIQPASSTELHKFKECDPSLSEAMLQSWLKQGDTCFVATDSRGNILHSHWISTTRAHIPELEMDLVLGPGEAYMYNATTRPELRGRGLFVGVRNFFVKRLYADGYEKLFFYVRGDNYIGLRAETRWLRSPGKFWYLQARGFRPLVIGRRLPELPALIRPRRPADEELGEGLSPAEFLKDISVGQNGHHHAAPAGLWQASEPRAPELASRKEKEVSL